MPFSMKELLGELVQAVTKGPGSRPDTSATFEDDAVITRTQFTEACIPWLSSGFDEKKGTGKYNLAYSVTPCVIAGELCDVKVSIMTQGVRIPPKSMVDAWRTKRDAAAVSKAAWEARK